MEHQNSILNTRFARRCLIAATIVLLICATTAGWICWEGKTSEVNAAPAASTLKLEDIPFDGAQAYEYLKQLCAIGPRPSGSPGMEKQQQLLAKYFADPSIGGSVEFQRFRVRHPQDGSWVPMANLIVRWHPERLDRVLLCAHYDTLPYPLMDRNNPRGVFVGANDNAGGVAILMQLARDIASLPTDYGIDFLLLDGEEFLFSPQGRFFLGSEYFARQYVAKKPEYHYRWGVLLDMVGDADLTIYQERNSLWWSDTRPLVERIWGTAARLGVREFVPEPKHEVQDDHLMLHNIGHIPCIDVIDFDYPAWHTQGDVPERCSPLSLAKVGWVIREWLRNEK
jgi:glutaminyl-peptide cyclotransferase